MKIFKKFLVFKNDANIMQDHCDHLRSSRKLAN